MLKKIAYLVLALALIGGVLSPMLSSVAFADDGPKLCAAGC
jgi:hypothetical protein